MTTAPSGQGLGSLAQAARGKQLRQARIILLLVGILTVAVQGYYYAAAETEVQSAIDKELASIRARGMVVDPVRVDQFKARTVRSVRLIAGGTVVLGLVFVACGILVKKYPVPTTVTSLVLYVGAVAVFAMMDPDNLKQGVFIKILIVLGLFKAVQAAIAYQKEMRAQPTSS
jgi:hypothetical protein